MKNSIVLCVTEMSDFADSAEVNFAKGLAAFTGIGGSYNLQSAVNHFKLAADAGHVEASGYLAQCYTTTPSNDINDIVHYASFGANHLDILGLSVFGWCHEYGVGVHKDPFKAVRLYKHAIKVAKDTERLGFGYADANENLGRCYLHGYGIIKDVSVADECFRHLVNWALAAANEGDVGAGFILGYLYLNGEGVEKNEIESLRWIDFAEKKGHPGALYWLGVHEEKSAQFLAAKEHYEKSAEQGYLHSFFSAGYWCYYFHQDEQAIKWYERAIETGNYDVYWALGRLYLLKDLSMYSADTGRNYLWKAFEHNITVDFSVSQIGEKNAVVDLGSDILETIFQYLDIASLWEVSKTCLAWRRVCEASDQRVWRRVLFNSFYRDKLFKIEYDLENQSYFKTFVNNQNDFIHTDIRSLFKPWVVRFSHSVDIPIPILNLNENHSSEQYQDAYFKIPIFRKLIKASLDGWKAHTLFRYFLLNERKRIKNLQFAFLKQDHELDRLVDSQNETFRKKISKSDKRLIFKFTDSISEYMKAMKVSLLLNLEGAHCVKSFQKVSFSYIHFSFKI
ncbi:hypothetical protein HK096_002589 [Nowakowskiella sp. JEL0078]|nr:hypothetical protein HK096_002589 [Nowakowskiella sp. JEL0078]